jgi:hypothetical protein
MMQNYLDADGTVSEYIAMGGASTKDAKKERNKKRSKKHKEEIVKMERQLQHQN